MHERNKNAYYNWLKKKDLPKNSASKLYLKEQIKIIFENSK
jgi:hypothetical protein